MGCATPLARTYSPTPRPYTPPPRPYTPPPRPYTPPRQYPMGFGPYRSTTPHADSEAGPSNWQRFGDGGPSTWPKFGDTPTALRETDSPAAVPDSLVRSTRASHQVGRVR